MDAQGPGSQQGTTASAGTSAASPTHRDGPMLFVESIDHPVCDPDDYHHVSRVLRVPDGSPIVVCDGAGRWRRATFGPEPTGAGVVYRSPRRSPAIAVAFALIKGDRPELIVQKLTELGVDLILPLDCDHGVVKWKGERAAKQIRRFERIAREAAMQCRRTHLPEIAAVRSFDDLLRDYPGTIRCDSGGVVASAAWQQAAGSTPVVVAVGPEGGWSERERSLGATVMGLGDHILRAETAAITAGALLAALRSSAL
ncbi:MAG: 16S rRNA (uracil(1498)-N(3))-methyltransferase [Microthrixaceae bacterium]|nr:16S rRNA (uracil(1498)-N(3))-methyltransferase [Microthrixaceae bacterium]